MDLNNQETGDNAQEADSVDSLIREHRTLDEKVTELSGRSYLTPEDDMELARLKKEKLRIKDKIAEMSSQTKSA
jgi:uncharacterized protein YdcH (DUF465 family)